jgi:hypothetical protein
MKRSQLTSCTIIVITALLALPGCEQEGPAEQAGENIDEAVEEMQEKARDASDQAMDKVEEATDKLEEKTD